jgi:chromosome segregation ATPase
METGRTSGVREIETEPTRSNISGNLVRIARNIPNQTGQVRVYSNNNFNRTADTLGNLTGEETEESTPETMNILRMTELRLLENELQVLKQYFEDLEQGMYSYSADRDTYNRDYNETSDRIDEVTNQVNSLRRSISAYLPTD